MVVPGSLSSLVCIAVLLQLASVAHAAELKIYRCEAADGGAVFQDQPCGTGLAPWDRPLTDRTRWSDPVQRSDRSCMVRSPEAKLSWLRADQAIEFDGGAYLELTVSESGIAAAILVEAGWPAEAAEQQAAASEATEYPVSDSGTAVSSGAFMGPIQVRRLELSGDIGDQALLPDAGNAFVVDAMDGTTRLTYGFGQTGNLLSALKRSASFKFQLRLRELGAPLYATPIELNGLEDALRAVRGCANR